MFYPDINPEQFFHCPQPIIVNKGKKWADGKLVTFPVSCSYNGGTIIKGKWYQGYLVPPPIIPDGFELVSIGCGLQLNACPPYATQLLRKKRNRNSSK